MASRALLHRSDIEDFSDWTKANGFTVHEPKGDFEALRIRKNKQWVIVYDRIRGDHFTVRDQDYPLVRAYYASKKSHDPAPSGISREDFWI
jgi:hypothetical protein